MAPPLMTTLAVLGGLLHGPGAIPPSTNVVPFLLTHLSLDLTIDYGEGSISGTARLTVRNVSGQPAARLPLMLNRLMAATSVSGADGAAVPFEQQVMVFTDDPARQVNAITVTCSHPVPPGDTLTIAVAYGGVLVGYTETGSLYIKDAVRRDFTIIREDAYAFPVLGLPSLVALRSAPRADFGFDATVRVPSPQVVAAGGTPLSPIRTDSTVTWRYRSSEPIPFLNITIAPYAVTEQGGTRVYHFPADSDGARTVAERTAAAEARLTEWFGPLGRPADLAIMEIPEGFGSQASLTAGILQTADAFRDRSQLPQLYHELSHLWNVEDLERPSPRWNEGLASFLQFRLAAELDGWRDWESRLERARATLLRRCAPVRCDTVPMVRFGEAGMTDLSYSSGFLMFYALFRALGPHEFDAAYRSFYQRYRTTGARTADLIASIRERNSAARRITDDWLLSTRWHDALTGPQPVEAILERYRSP